jgi:hypothetical protein
MTDADEWQQQLDRQFDDDLEWARWGVSRWAGFPVDQVPRPLVLLGPTSHARNGFYSHRAKRAFMNGWIQTEVAVPEAVLALLGRRPGPPDAEAAVVITAAGRCEVEQQTDRGPRRLPGWRLESDDTRGPILALDPEVIAQAWAPPETDPTHPPRPARGQPRGDPLGERASLAADGRTLTFRFIGALPMYERYPTAEVIESPHAVAVVPHGEDVGPPGMRIPPGYGHKIVVTLREPLGARVLVDRHGNAAEVTVASG